MAFGKRKTPPGAAAHQPPDASSLVSPAPAETIGLAQATPDLDPPPRQKVFPDDVWEGKTGDFLRLLGKSPDDEPDLVPDNHPVNERLARDRARHEEKLADINARIRERFPDAAMRPFSLLPDACWNGELGHLLMCRLELFPFDDWNMIFLPSDMKTAEALELPVHPGRDISDFVDTAMQFLHDADHHLAATHKQAGETGDLEIFADAMDEMRDKVKGLARKLLGELDKRWENRSG
jgi:hypothetical protein